MTTKQQAELRDHARFLGAAVARHVFEGGHWSARLDRVLFYCRGWVKPRCGYRWPRSVPWEIVTDRVAELYMDLDWAGVCYG